MLYNEKTEIGTIKYDVQIIGNIVKKIVFDMNQGIQFATSKGRPLKVSELPGVDDNGFLDVSIEDGNIDIEIYIIIRFGTSINNVAEEITAGLRRFVPEITGLTPNLVNVVIKGVISKNSSKRNIEVKSYADGTAQ